METYNIWTCYFLIHVKEIFTFHENPPFSFWSKLDCRQQQEQTLQTDGQQDFSLVSSLEKNTIIDLIRPKKLTNNYSFWR